MSFTSTDIATSTYLFLIMGGIIALAGSLVVYFNKKPRLRR